MSEQNNTSEQNAPAEEEPIISPERAAHLRNLRQSQKVYDDMLSGKYLSRTHGDQQRGS